MSKLSEAKVNINESFLGIQGEGITQGQYRQFIRFNSCNLSCSWCDTKYSWEKGDKNIDLKIEYPKIVITGGEPLLEENWEFIYKNIFEKKIELELNGLKLKQMVL